MNEWKPIETAPREKHPRTKVLIGDLLKMVEMKDSGIRVIDIAKVFNISKEYASRLTTAYAKGFCFEVPRN